jgi:response regulator RpfG family c-di-GMP phosphodiesterase
VQTLRAKPKILVLNDDENLLETRRRLLESCGAQVYTGCGTRESIHAILVEPADLVLIDVTNVGLRHGEFLCETVKQMHPEQKVAILVTPEMGVPDGTRADRVIYRSGPRRILVEVNEMIQDQLDFDLWEVEKYDAARA